MPSNINMFEFADMAEEHGFDINCIVEVGSFNAEDALFLKGRFPNAKVYAIEGSPDSFQKHMAHISGITVVNRVICNFDGEIDFFLKENPCLSSIFDRGRHVFPGEIKKVECSTLDSFCASYGIGSIDMMKIDVEGASYEVFCGASGILDTVKIMHIETEDYPFFSGQTLHGEVLKFLRDRGFKMIMERNARIARGHQYDSVWIKDETRDLCSESGTVL